MSLKLSKHSFVSKKKLHESANHTAKKTALRIMSFECRNAHSTPHSKLIITFGFSIPSTK